MRSPIQRASTGTPIEKTGTNTRAVFGDLPPPRLYESGFPSIFLGVALSCSPRPRLLAGRAWHAFAAGRHNPAADPLQAHCNSRAKRARRVAGESDFPGRVLRTAESQRRPSQLNAAGGAPHYQLRRPRDFEIADGERDSTAKRPWNKRAIFRRIRSRTYSLLSRLIEAPRADSIDSLAHSLTLAGFVYVAPCPRAPFPPAKLWSRPGVPARANSPEAK